VLQFVIFIIGLWVGFVVPAHALITMDAESVTMALRYGMTNQNKGIAGLLGSNWMEGPDGMLLNIYTPFMLLATKAARGGYPTAPSEDDLTAARKQYARMIQGLTDTQETQRVKFAISFLGEQPTFAVNTTAVIKGIADGREITLKPSRQLRQPSATVKPSEADSSRYEAVNSYYFNQKDLARFESYQFIVTLPSGQPATFSISNSQIY
jgi:hypothetical protein